MISKEQKYLNAYQSFIENIINIPEELIFNLCRLMPKQSILKSFSNDKFPFFERRKEQYLKYKPELWNILHEIQENSYFASTLTEELYGIYSKNIDRIKDFLKDKNQLPYVLKSLSNGSSKTKQIPYNWFLPIVMKDIEYVIYCNFFRFYKTSEKKRYKLTLVENESCSFDGKTTFFSNEISFNNHEALKKLIDINEKNIILEIQPMSLYKMLSDKDVVNLFKDIDPVICITDYDSTGYDFSRLKDLNIPLINQMTSWKEGVSFYTCPYGKFHWMENLFYCTSNKKVVDLFNFCNDWWDKEDGNPDNIWPLGQDFHQCACRTWYREMNFQPHAIKGIKNYKDELVNNFGLSISNFKEKYEYFQIVQQKDGKTFHVHVSKQMHEQDLSYATDWIKKKYEKNDVVVDMISIPYLVGSRLKAPIFWSEC